jgi:hypothetical protein
MKACKEALYFAGNMHLNHAGHRFVAEELRRFIQARPGLLHDESREAR